MNNASLSENADPNTNSTKQGAGLSLFKTLTETYDPVEKLVSSSSSSSSLQKNQSVFEKIRKSRSVSSNSKALRKGDNVLGYIDRCLNTFDSEIKRKKAKINNTAGEVLIDTENQNLNSQGLELDFSIIRRVRITTPKPQVWATSCFEAFDVSRNINDSFVESGGDSDFMDALLTWKYENKTVVSSNPSKSEFLANFERIDSLCSLYRSYVNGKCESFALHFNTFCWISFIKMDDIDYVVISNSNSKIKDDLKEASIKFTQPFKKKISIIDQDNTIQIDETNGEVFISDEMIDEDIREYERYTGTRVIEWQTEGGSLEENDASISESLLLLKGKMSIHQLFDALMNSRFSELCLHQCIMYSHQPFLHASSSRLQFKSRKVLRSGNVDFSVKSSSALKTEYLMEISGPLMPSNVQKIQRVVEREHSNEYSMNLVKECFIPKTVLE